MECLYPESTRHIATDEGGVYTRHESPIEVLSNTVLLGHVPIGEEMMHTVKFQVHRASLTQKFRTLVCEDGQEFASGLRLGVYVIRFE